MKKNMLLSALILSCILSSCEYGSDGFMLSFTNEGNDSIFISLLDGEKTSRKNRAYILNIQYDILESEGKEISIVIPDKIYIEKYETDITLYALGGSHGINGPQKECGIYFMLNFEEKDPDIPYHINIDLNGLKNVSSYVNLFLNNVRIYEFTHTFFNEKVN